jgi:hypothetical protein
LRIVDALPMVESGACFSSGVLNKVARGGQTHHTHPARAENKKLAENGKNLRAWARIGACYFGNVGSSSAR